jgi:hypothetical protein
VLLCAFGVSSLAHAGIADRYPGDIGIENDPEVVFVENFEEASVSALAARWEDVVGQNLMSLSADRPAGSGSSQSALFNGGAHLYRLRLRAFASKTRISLLHTLAARGVPPCV